MQDSQIVVQRQTILIADDDQLNLSATSMLLTAYGFDVLTATGGLHAKQLIEQRYREIDLVLSDLHMPDLDGIALFERLRASNYMTPFVLYSGHLPHRDSIPTDAVLSKPASFDQFSSAFTSLIGTFSATTQIAHDDEVRVCPACCQQRRSLGMPPSFKIGHMKSGMCDRCGFRRA